MKSIDKIDYFELYWITFGIYLQQSIAINYCAEFTGIKNYYSFRNLVSERD